MCGRFSLIHAPEEVAAWFALDALEAFPPRYNIAPTQPVLVVAHRDLPGDGTNAPPREGRLMRWGLLPSWVKEPESFPTLINARSETAATKPSFRAAMRHRRCVMPASGFYEWHRPGGKQKPQAWWVPQSQGQPVAFAALHETWIGADGSEIDTVAVLTTEATGAFAHIHNRIPVVIPPEDITRWMDCKSGEPRDVADLLVEPPQDFFAPVPVSDRVNKVANDGPDNIVPVDVDATATPAKPDDTPKQGSLF